MLYPFFGLIFIIFGVISVWKPYIAWYLAIGWQIQDAEPTDMALLWNRIAGIIFILVGIKILF